MKVSFDYDDTLTKREVLEYAITLVNNGVDVHIYTNRLENSKQLSLEHQEVKDVANYIGIPEENIHYCGTTQKHKELDDSIIWHLDDTWKCIHNVNKYTKTMGILLKDNWKEKCNKLLKKRNRL